MIDFYYIFWEIFMLLNRCYIIIEVRIIDSRIIIISCVIFICLSFSFCNISIVI